MKNTKQMMVISFFLSLLLSACSQLEFLNVTETPFPTHTNTLSPTPITTDTPVATATASSTPTSTSTPEPICNPNNTIQGAIDDVPGYIDILSVSTELEGTSLTVVFTMRDIPEEITINHSVVQDGRPEIAWGIVIDKDNNTDTGGGNFIIGGGLGYDTVLQAFNFKQGTERKGTIQNLFRSLTMVWDIEQNKISSGAAGKIEVDQDAKTITLNANIPGIQADSYLSFYTFFNDGEERFSDELCGRQ